jgi:hypothetical protein
MKFHPKIYVSLFFVTIVWFVDYCAMTKIVDDHSRFGCQQTMVIEIVLVALHPISFLVTLRYSTLK